MALLELCEKSIMADVESLVYWRVNRWLGKTLASPDYKVFFLINYDRIYKNS